MKKGEIWLARLAKSKSVGHEYYNDRPALVIISDKLIPAVSVITIMPMSTSGIMDKDDIYVSRGKKNGLNQDSIIKTHHIMSYDKSRFIHKIGETDSTVMNQVEMYLKNHFGIK